MHDTYATCDNIPILCRTHAAHVTTFPYNAWHGAWCSLTDFICPTCYGAMCRIWF